MTVTMPLQESLLSRLAQMMNIERNSEEYRRREIQLRDITHTHGSLIARLCFYYSNSKTDFDDLRQDCLINIWKGLSTFDNRSALSTWVYRVCLNTCVSSLRKSSARPAEVSLELAQEVAGEDNTERREQLEDLYNRLSSLSLMDRAIIMMWLDERPNSEIAEVTGLSSNNVAVRIHRIKSKLKKDEH